MWTGLIDSLRVLRIVVTFVCTWFPWPFSLTGVTLGWPDRLRVALEHLGPLFVKLGQNLATRPDIITAEMAQALRQLHDRVPPFSAVWARQSVERCLKRPLPEVFLQFEDTPLASASIAQVHAAVLHSGEAVAVKILRPGIRKRIAQDLRILGWFAGFLGPFHPFLRRMRLPELVEECRFTFNQELNLLAEAANASQLKRHFADSSLLYVPRVYWQWTGADMLVTERLYGTPVTQLADLRAQGVDCTVLAKRIVQIFFTQVFEHAFFHADMHAGNLLVRTEVPAEPRVEVVDFGIMGTLQTVDQRYLAHNLFAFLHRDYQRVAQLHIESGWVPPDTRADLFETAIRTVCEPMFEQPLKDVSFGVLLWQLFQTAKTFRMELLPQLVLLQKTLINVEGLARQLDPELDIWQEARPIIETWMHKELGWRGCWNKIRDKWPLVWEQLPEWPELIYRALQRAADHPNAP